MNNEITPQQIAEFLKSEMEDMSVADAVLALAADKKGHWVNNRHVEVLPKETPDGATGYWVIETKTLGLTMLVFYEKEEDGNGYTEHSIYQFVLGHKKRVSWDPDFIRKENREWYVASPLRNVERASLIADELWLIGTARLLNVMIQARDNFAEAHNDLEKQCPKNTDLTQTLVRHVARLDFGEPDEDSKHSLMLGIFQ